MCFKYYLIIYNIGSFNFLIRALDQLKDINGKKLLSLKRNELISAFGKVEGARLDGQLQICRKTTGYGTASSELRNVLAKAKKRTEEEDIKKQHRRT